MRLAHNTELKETVSAVGGDGTIDIDFEQGEAENPQVNAIELVTIGEEDEPNQPPTVDAIDDQTVTKGETVEVGVSATDPDDDELTLSVDGPEFISLSDAGDGTGTLTVAPEDGDVGTYTHGIVSEDDSVSAASTIGPPALEGFDNPPQDLNGDGQVDVGDVQTLFDLAVSGN